MAGIRMQVVPLNGYQTDRPFKIPLDCAYWRVIISEGVAQISINAVPLSCLGVLSVSGKIDVDISVSPVFDGHGRAINWQDELLINPVDNAINGSVLLFYLDETLPGRP